MTRRYRGENSNVDDIAARFDKHLDEPVRFTRITAHSSVVKCSPGLYQLRTVLMTMVTNWKHAGKRTLTKRTKRRQDPTKHEAAYIEYPDDELELWNRPVADGGR